MRRRSAVLILALCVALVGSVAEAGKRRRKIPNMPRNWSWPPTPSMIDAGTQCLADLDALGVKYERAKPTKKVATPIVLPDLTLGEITLQSKYRKGPFVMDCHLARGLAKHSAALRTLGVKTLRFTQIHDYRHVERNGKRTNILSRHAIGLAMDVSAIVLDDGTELAVKRDYGSGPNVLHSVEALVGGVEDFRTPLTPGNDPQGHDDHFHFEAQMFLPD